MLLLLIHNDESEVVKGSKYGRTGTNGDKGLALSHTLPLVKALSHRHSRVEHRHLAAVTAVKDLEGLRSQGYLGHHYDDSPALRYDLVNDTQKDLRLSAARHSVKKCGRAVLGAVHIHYALKGGILLIGKGYRRIRLGRAVIFGAVDLVIVAEDGALFLKGGYYRLRNAGKVAYLLDRSGADLAQKFGDRLLLGGPFAVGVEIVAQAGHSYRCIADTAHRVIDPHRKPLGNKVVGQTAVGIELHQLKQAASLNGGTAVDKVGQHQPLGVLQPVGQVVGVKSLLGAVGCNYPHIYACGQHQPYRIVVGTEGVLAYPADQF